MKKYRGLFLMLTSILFVAISCAPFDDEGKVIDNIVGDYEVYTDIYLNYVALDRSVTLIDTIDMTITKVSSDIVSLDAFNTTAQIIGNSIIIKKSTEIHDNGYMEMLYRDEVFASNVLQFAANISGRLDSPNGSTSLSGVMTAKAVKKP